jgi:SAM-dependent methyltransferase
MIDLENITTGLEQKNDGIWYASRKSSVSYPDDGHERAAQLEDESFWFRHRNDCIVALVNSYPPARGGPIFDIGGGNGFVAQGLTGAGYETVLVEPSAYGARTGLERGLRGIVCSTLKDARFEPSSLPAVGLFDVVEHIEDDANFLRTIHGLLMERGRVYLTVPAYSWLWSDADVRAGHYRRHTIDSVERLLTSAGFEVEFSTYFFRFLPLPIFLFRALPFRLGFAKNRITDMNTVRRAHTGANGMKEDMVQRVLAPEIRRINESRPMYFGGSCLVAASKR